MATYTIKDLETLSGIKAQTLRMWEQRYGLVIPGRTQSNIRYYNEQDLKDLLNIATLNKNGFKISAIAKMSKEEIQHKANELSILNIESDPHLNGLMMAMLEMSECKFHCILSKSIKEQGFENTMLSLVFPFVEKLGLLWLTAAIKPAQRNFISQLIKQKLSAAIHQLNYLRSTPCFLLFLPEGEADELQILFMHYLLKKRQFRVVYLGAHTRIADLKDANNCCKPDYFVTSISENFHHQPLQKYINEITQAFPSSCILLSGYQVNTRNIEYPPNTMILKDFHQSISLFDRLKNNQNSSPLR